MLERGEQPLLDRAGDDRWPTVPDRAERYSALAPPPVAFQQLSDNDSDLV